MIKFYPFMCLAGIAPIAGGVMAGPAYPYQSLLAICFGGFLIWKSIDRQDPPLGV